MCARQQSQYLDNLLTCNGRLTSIKEHSVSLSSLEVQGDLVAAAYNRLTAILRHVVEQVLVAPESRFRRLFGCSQQTNTHKEARELINAHISTT